jgi:hypothetical protein
MITNVLQAIGWVVLGASVLLQGCVPLLAVGAGAVAAGGTVAYVNGDLETTYPAALNRTWDATMGALQDAQLRITDTQRDATQGTIKAQQADATPVTVSLETAGPNTTDVKIRVGTFGDEEVSRTINRRLAARLGTAAG